MQIIARRFLLLLLILLLLASAAGGAPAYAHAADALVVLGGSPDARAAMGARLYAMGAAPLVIASGGGVSLARGLDILRSQGVPDSALIVNDTATTTYDEAVGNIAILRALGVRAALIVTHDWHSARALATYRHLDSTITYMATGLHADLAPPSTAADYMKEDAKRLRYLLLYGVPFARARNACDFSGAERVVIGDYATFESIESTDVAVIRAPSAWSGDSFWEGYASATPFGTFYDMPMRYLATFTRGREVVGIIEVRGEWALMLDEDGKVPDSDVWHGCAALVLDERALAWFEAGE